MSYQGYPYEGEGVLPPFREHSQHVISSVDRANIRYVDLAEKDGKLTQILNMIEF